MDAYIETENLILREIKESDVDGIYELDSDKQVHKYFLEMREHKKSNRLKVKLTEREIVEAGSCNSAKYPHKFEPEGKRMEILLMMNHFWHKRIPSRCPPNDSS